MSNWTNCLSDANVSATMTQGADIRPIHPNEIQDKIDDILDTNLCLCLLFTWEYLPVAVGDIVSFNEWEELKDLIDVIDNASSSNVADLSGENMLADFTHWSNDEVGHNSIDYDTEDATHKTTVNVNHDTNKFGTDLALNHGTYYIGEDTTADTGEKTGHDASVHGLDDGSYLSVDNTTHYGTVRVTHYQTANDGN